MKTIIRFLPVIAILLAVVLTAPIASADMLSKGITLYTPAKLGATELKPGDYWINFDGKTLSVLKGKGVVAEAKAEWADAKAIVEGDSVIIEKGVITEIRIDGRNRVIKIH